MSRIPRLAVLALSLVTLSATAAQLVAPRPVSSGPLTYEDRDAVSISNGETTLIAWTNAYSPYAEAHHVYLRLLDGPGDGIGLAAGTNPRLATNGRDYLVGYTLGRSRFQVLPYDNVAVQLVSSDGRPGTRRILNRSVSGYLGAVAWNGEYWVAGYSKDNDALVALLDTNLNRMATIEAGLGNIADIVNVAGTTWAFRHRYNQPTEAIEILRDGTAGRRHTLAVPSQHIEIVPTTNGALVFLGVENGTEVATFDPASGFSAVRLLADRSLLRDAKPFGDGAAVVTVHADSTATELFGVGANGTVTEKVVLRPDGSIHTARYLGESKHGLLYFEQVQGGGMLSHDLYLTRFTGLQLAQTAELISTANLAYQHSALIAANQTHAVAFWKDEVKGELLPMSSRAIDAAGQPFGAVGQLERIPRIDDIAFDGRQFIAVWWAGGNIYAATITADGQRAGMAMLLGPGELPAIASNGSATFVVWRNAGELYGTNVHPDASAAIPGGFQLLPAFGETSTPPRIAALDDGFLVAWSTVGMRTVILTQDGIALHGFELMPNTEVADLVNSDQSALALVARPGANVLQSFARNGDPAPGFDPQWGSWWPVSVTPVRDDNSLSDRYLVTIGRDDLFFTSEVTTTEGGAIIHTTPLRLLGDTAASVTTINGTPLHSRSDGMACTWPPGRI